MLIIIIKKKRLGAVARPIPCLLLLFWFPHDSSLKCFIWWCQQIKWECFWDWFGDPVHLSKVVTSVDSRGNGFEDNCNCNMLRILLFAVVNFWSLLSFHWSRSASQIGFFHVSSSLQSWPSTHASTPSSSSCNDVCTNHSSMVHLFWFYIELSLLQWDGHRLKILAFRPAAE